MRITLKFLVKALVVLIVLIFALPLFLHHLDSKEWEKMEELARAKRDRAVSIIVHYNAITSKLHVLSYLNSSENIYRYRLHVYLQVQVTGLFTGTGYRFIYRYRLHVYLQVQVTGLFTGTGYRFIFPFSALTLLVG